MQIVIDIPEETYEYLSKIANAGEEPLGYFERVIMRGTPLPKGHGKMIDADVLCDYFWDNRSKLYTHKDLQIVIDNAPTVIEADDYYRGAQEEY